MADTEWGEKVVAAVVLQPGADVSEPDLQQWGPRAPALHEDARTDPLPRLLPHNETGSSYEGCSRPRPRQARASGRRTGQPSRTSTPGLRRPVGSKRCLIRRCRARRPGSAVRRRRLGVVHDADADLGDERCRSRRRSPGRHRPPAAGRQRGRPVGSTTSSRHLAATSRSSPSSSTHVVVPSHSTDVGRYSRASTSTGRRGP